MNKEYLKWLREVQQDWFSQFYDEWFWNFLRSGQFREMYKNGDRPDMAASNMLPW